MHDVAIRCAGLSKRYSVGRLRRNDLRETLSRSVRGLLRRPSRGDHGAQDFWALNDVSFEVCRGEVIGIIGRNGAGKSTLLKILSRITKPTRGLADLNGRVSSLLEVGTGFHPELTGRENIYLNGTILGMRRAEIRRKFDEIVAFAEVEKFLDTPVKRYSSGMYVRLAFGVAAHLDPEILMVDEVLAVGDTAFQKKCLGKMSDVPKQGKTVLFVSHNMAAISHLCPRSVLLNAGAIEFDGSTKECIRRYLGSPAESGRRGTSLGQWREGAVELADVRVLDDSDAEVDIVGSGQDVKFQMIIKSTVSLDNVACVIGIEDMWGARLALLGTMLVGEGVAIRPPETRVTCRVPRLPLVPGEYTLSPSLYHASVFPEPLVSAPNSVKVQVDSGDFFGSGVIYRESWAGSVLLDQAWSRE
jgi:lipopolysaccharide transport system ATP-binding protein